MVASTLEAKENVSFDVEDTVFGVSNWLLSYAVIWVINFASIIKCAYKQRTGIYDLCVDLLPKCLYIDRQMTSMVKISKLLSDSKRGIFVNSSKDFINLSRQGLSYGQLKRILLFTNLTIKQLSKLLSISERQLSRYSKDKILKTDISSHLILIVELYDFGYEVFDSEEDFQIWMNSEIRALSYQKPINLLDTPFGINDVKNVLGRLEYGVYS